MRDAANDLDALSFEIERNDRQDRERDRHDRPGFGDKICGAGRQTKTNE